MYRTLFVATLFSLLLLAACSDPTGNSASANTGDAKKVVEESGKELTFSQEGSKISFVGAKVTMKHPGGFSKFAGKVITSDDGKTVKQVEVDIDLNSLWAANDGDGADKPNEKLTGHLKSADFFNVEKHPKGKFVSTEIKKDGDNFTVTGNLTFHDVTKSVTFPAKITADAGKVTAKAEFKINRHDWKLDYNGAIDNAIHDDVAILFDIQAK